MDLQCDKSDLTKCSKDGIIPGYTKSAFRTWADIMEMTGMVTCNTTPHYNTPKNNNMSEIKSNRITAEDANEK